MMMSFRIDFAFVLLCLLATSITLLQTIHGVPHASSSRLHLRGRVLSSESSSHGHGHGHDDEGVSVDGSGGDDEHGHDGKAHGHDGHGHDHGSSSSPVHVRIPGGYIDIPGADITPSTPLTVRVPGLSPSAPVHVRVPAHKSSPVVVRVPPQEQDNYGHHAHAHEHHD